MRRSTCSQRSKPIYALMEFRAGLPATMYLETDTLFIAASTSPAHPRCPRPTCTAMYLDIGTLFIAVSTSTETSPSLRPVPLLMAFSLSFSRRPALFWKRSKT